jgi:PAS domain S-box-containing protein
VRPEIAPLVDALPFVVYQRLPATGNLCFVSQPVERLTGYSPATWLAHPDLWRDSIHPDDRTTVLAEFEAGLAARRPFTLDYRLVAAKGRVLWIRDAAVWVAATDETPNLWQGTWTDITAQRKTETELQHSNERFAALFGTDVVGIAVSSVATGRILDVNERAETILRLSRAELVGHGWLELGFWDGQQAERRALIDRVMAGNPVRSEPLRLRHPSGEVLDLALSVEQIELGGEPCLVSLFDDVSERHRAEIEAQRLAAIVDASGDAIVRLALNGVIQTWNTGAEHLYGYAASEAVGQPISMLIPAERREEFAAILERVGAGESFARLESHRLTKDRRLVDVSLTISPIRDRSDSVVAIATIARDVTAWKAAQRDVADRTAQLAAIVDSAMDAIVTVDPDQCILVFNQAAETMFGTSAADAIGQPLVRFMPERFRAAHAAHVNHFAETNVTSRTMGGLGAIWGRRATGEEFPIEAAISQITVGGRKLLTVILRDISQRLSAERELRHRADLLNHAYDAIVVWEWDGPITFWNDGARRLYGYAQDEAIGRIGHELLRSEFPDGTPAHALLSDLKLDGVWEGELLQTRRDGEVIVVESRHVVVEQDGRRLVLEANRDVTARKRAEDEARQLNAELERRVAQRTAQLEAVNKELEAFTYSASHDLRAPLRGIDGFSQALLEDYGDRLDDDGRNYIDRIRRATDRMGRLIDDLLSLSRITRTDVNKEQINLSALARQVCDELAAAEPKRQVEVVVEPGLMAAADPRLMRIALTNLIGNAWKFTSKRADARIEVASDGTGPEPIIVVRDNGAGFDMRHADRLFGAFQRLHHVRDYPGTGIGLATVERIVHRHGGRVWVEAEVDRGANFFFTLGNQVAGGSEGNDDE